MADRDHSFGSLQGAMWRAERVLPLNPWVVLQTLLGFCETSKGEFTCSPPALELAKRARVSRATALAAIDYLVDGLQVVTRGPIVGRCRSYILDPDAILALPVLDPSTVETRLASGRVQEVDASTGQTPSVQEVDGKRPGGGRGASQDARARRPSSAPLPTKEPETTSWCNPDRGRASGAGQGEHHDHEPQHAGRERKAAESESERLAAIRERVEREQAALAPVKAAWLRAKGRGFAVGSTDEDFLRRAVAEHGADRVLAKIESVAMHATRGVSLAYLDAALKTPDGAAVRHLGPVRSSGRGGSSGSKGSAFTGSGIGRAWDVLTDDWGDPKPHIREVGGANG